MIVFIYHKDGKIKVFDHESAKKEQKDLFDQGYTHVSTINSVQFIQHLYNDCKDKEIIREVKSLTVPF
jgi:hypothetical protein